MYNVIILGPQGSGKGTQADLLSKQFNIPRIESGNLWRNEIALNTEMGRRQVERQNRGELANDEDTIALVKNKLAGLNGFLLDGFPRNVFQSQALDAFVKISHVIVLSLSEEDSLKRLLGRLFCKKCGRSYHVVYNPPVYQYGEKWLCDDDKEELAVRGDDKEDAIRQRLAIYRQQTEPLIETYRPRGIVHEIDAADSIENVNQKILRVLEK